jgi:hypothetical protein
MKRRSTHDKKIHDAIFKILGYKKNVNLNYSEIPFQLRQKGTIKKTTKYKCR